MMDPSYIPEETPMPKDKPQDRTGGSCDNLTVRDAFAGLALEALIGMTADEFDAVYVNEETSGGVFNTLAELAYRHADAMLEARKK